MKKTLRNDFPHPVLIDNSSDYINCNFELSEPENVRIEGEYLYFDINYVLVSDGLKKLLKEGEARVVIKIYSPKTAYRNTFDFNNACNLNIVIPKDIVAEKIELQGSIVANNQFANFCLEEHNKDLFGTTCFEIRKADILALSKKIIIPLDASELEGPVSSIFMISKSSDLNTAVKPDFDDESGKINIHLDTKTYDTYSLLRAKSHELKRYLAAVIVFPVLIEALSFMNKSQSEESEDAEKRWYKMINKKLEQKNINLDEIGITEAANILLGNIVQEALISFGEKMNLEFDDEFENGGAD